jgi:hypothetical protein
MPEIFYPRKRDWVFVLVGSIALLILGGWAIGSGESPLLRCLGGFLAILSIVGILLALLHLHPNSSFLKLTAQGITVRSFWRTTEYRWVDISEFGVAEFQTQQQDFRQTHQRVGFNFSRYSPQLKRATSPDRFIRRVGGYEAALPDTYGQDYATLAAFLNQQRDHFLGQDRVRTKDTPANV